VVLLLVHMLLVLLLLLVLLHVHLLLADLITHLLLSWKKGLLSWKKGLFDASMRDLVAAHRHRELLQSVLQGLAVGIVFKRRCLVVQGILQPLGHMRQLLVPILCGVGSASLQEQDDVLNHVAA